MTVLHDDDELERCYRHPARETALSCSNCGRPICTDCAIAAPVGIKCPECAKQPRAARAAVPTARLARGVVVGLVLAVVAGFVYGAVGRGGFFALIIAGAIGVGIAEAVRWATGGFRDHRVAQVAAGCAVLAIGGPVVVDVVRYGIDPVVHSSGEVFALLGAVIAAVYAYNRVN